MSDQRGAVGSSEVEGEALRRLRESLLAASEIYQEAGGVDLAEFPLEQTQALIEAYPRERSYDYVSVEVATQSLLIKHRYGLRSLLCYHAALLIHLIDCNHTQLIASDYPQSVKDLGIENFERILTLLIDGSPDSESSEPNNPPDYLHYQSDQFFKDLSAATLDMLVCGGRKLGRVKFPLGLLKSHPIAMSRYVFKNGYSGTYLETHFDSNDNNLRARFGAESWDTTLKVAAELMLQDSSIKGFVGHSWYYDPCLSEVAPNLAHIGGVIMANGGSLFCTGISESTTESALRNSTVRQGLYAMDLYQPKRFKILWPRAAALSWLSAQGD